MTAVAASAPRKVSLPTSTVLVAKRALLAFVRTPQLIGLYTIQMAMFLIAFRYVFGGAIGTRNGLSYVDFAVPGFITSGVLYTTLGTAIGMAEDLQSGLMDRFRSLPMPQAAVLTGRMLADMAVLVWCLAVTTGVGFVLGFRLSGSVLDGLAAFGMCLLFGVAFIWVFIALGLLAGNVKAANGMTLFVFIFTFASNAYVPAATMPSWLRAFAENQPITQMVDAVRALTLGSHAHALLGHYASYYVRNSLLWSAGIVIVFFALALYRFRRN